MQSIYFLIIWQQKQINIIFVIIINQKHNDIMTSTSETGHAKNVANFQDLIEFVTAYGADYNPSKESLKLPQLIALKTAAENNLADVISKSTNYNNQVNQRISAF